MADQNKVTLIALQPVNHGGRVLEIGEEFEIDKPHDKELVRAKEAAAPGDKAARKAVAEFKKKQAASEEPGEEGELTEAQARKLSKFNDATAAQAIAMIEAEDDEETLVSMAAIEEGKAAGSRKSVLEAFKSKGIEA